MKNSSADLGSLLVDLEELKHDIQTIKAGSKLLDDLRIVQDHLGRTSSGLQRGILATRMVPIGPMFNRFQRMVRDLAQTTGKKFEFEIVGENVELDKRGVRTTCVARRSRSSEQATPEPPALSGPPRRNSVTSSSSTSTMESRRARRSTSTKARRSRASTATSRAAATTRSSRAATSWSSPQASRASRA